MLTLILAAPKWVWLLLAVLVYGGLRDLRSRAVKPVQLLYLPLAFLLWNLKGVVAMPGSNALLAFVGVLAWSGSGLAAQAARQQVDYDPASGLLHRAGSAYTLVLSLSGFVAKFAFATWLAVDPLQAQSPWVGLLYGALSGLLCGLLGGAPLMLWLRSRQLGRGLSLAGGR